MSISLLRFLRFMSDPRIDYGLKGASHGTDRDEAMSERVEAPDDLPLAARKSLAEMVTGSVWGEGRRGIGLRPASRHIGWHTEREPATCMVVVQPVLHDFS